MSRSKRKTPVKGITTADSEKYEKRIYNRRFRRALKEFIHSRSDDQPEPTLREYSNPWTMEKDGKSRFDPDKYPELMRK